MKKILMAAMLALLMLTAGCDKPPVDTPPAEPPAKPVETKPESKPEVKPEPTKPEPDKPIKPVENKPARHEKTEQSMNVKVYYPDDSGMRLVEVEREIIVDDSVDKYTAAVEALLEVPDEENLTTIFPKNTRFRKVTVKDGLATVDIDGSILKGFVGGSTGEEFLIGSIVDTLTNFPEVKRVKFLVDGQEIETLSGHMDLSAPLERMNSLTE
ncbi:MAG: GerMN domain-containing protein [Selenomonadaceae bacterium]|nr:GerMN domain-containing protein [Selenomonadaceae bacterium]